MTNINKRVKPSLFTLILGFLSKPFGTIFPKFVAITLLCATPKVIFFIEGSYFKYAIYLLLWNSIISYCICLISSLFKGVYVKIYWAIIATIGILYYSLECVYVIGYDAILVNDTITAVLCSNMQEAIEMASNSLNIHFIYKFILISSVILSIYVILRKFPLQNNISKYSLLFVFFLFVPFGFRNHSAFVDTPLSNIYLLFSIEDDLPDLHNYLSNPNVTTLSNNGVDNIVIIIGESHSKSHSSLYGYKKNTNPRLAKLLTQNDSCAGKLLVFNNVCSPAMYTTEAFKRIMSNFKGDSTDSKKWYEYTTFIETLKNSGYKTHWFSNQSKHGFYDNLVNKYAELCDTNLFVGSKLLGIQRKTYDEEVIELKKSLIRDKKKSLDIYHLMGSHPSFSLRFPSNRAIFQPNDYPNLQSHQRTKIADYDNSLVYNDSVISEIINLYEENDAIIIYFPDHALDLYESDSSHIGHGKLNNASSEKYATSIPFLVYLSPIFIFKRPDTTEEIEKAINNCYSTTNTIYTVMKLSGIKFADNQDVEDNAMF